MCLLDLQSHQVGEACEHLCVVLLYMQWIDPVEYLSSKPDDIVLDHVNRTLQVHYSHLHSLFGS